MKVCAYLNGSALSWTIDGSNGLTTQVDNNVGTPSTANDITLLVNELTEAPNQKTQDANISVCRLSTIENDFMSRSADGLQKLIAYSGVPILPVRYDKCEEVKDFHAKLENYAELENAFNNLPEKTSSEYITAVNRYNELVLAYNE